MVLDTPEENSGSQEECLLEAGRPNVTRGQRVWAQMQVSRLMWKLV